ncbi:unnamed protein product [Brassica napus]|uniref:(rape) hypothetical protein n=1 Tax=Brassica napus TaxID=3708 RepID=A0A816IUS1_BRANA|nr:unnamed protein product [Brassica napus]
MKIAIEGCMHGDLDNVYKTIQHHKQIHNTKVDLLLCCGDFQNTILAVRNEKDMDSLSVPIKYREVKSFWKYYSGQEVAPVPTIFIGGNHEASNYLWELYYGGWAATNIYFLGYAGAVKYCNLRIGGLSGIYNGQDYRSVGHFERPPYNKNTIRSVYHVREYDVHKLMQLEEPLDIFLSHDWPVGITDYGDSKVLLIQQKPYFQEEIETRTLGSKPAALLLEKLKPRYWFSAHLHCKFAASIQHGSDGSVTKFLALDKCAPGKNFLQIIEVESEPGAVEILYDEEWLAITRKFNSVFPLTQRRANFSSAAMNIEESREWVRKKLEERQFKPFEFVKTVPAYNPSQRVFDSIPDIPQNPQTLSLLELLGLPYLLDSSPVTGERTAIPASPALPSEIPIDDIDDLEEIAEAKADDPTRE